MFYKSNPFFVSEFKSKVSAAIRTMLNAKKNNTGPNALPVNAKDAPIAAVIGLNVPPEDWITNSTEKVPLTQS